METLEPIQPDAPLIVASLLVLAVLASSAVLWIRHIQKPKTSMPPQANAPAWSISWVDFGIFICAMVIAMVFVPLLAANFFFEPSADPNASRELTPELAVASVLLLQLPMLAVFYLARRFFPALYAGRLNGIQLSLGQAFGKALPLFLMFLPVVWIASLLWANLLNGLEALGWLKDVEQQQLVTLFQTGGDPFYIGLLVIFAVVLAPIVEESVFRGCIYRFLKGQMTLLPAQIISGCLFSLMHFNLMSFVPLVVVGVLLARVYEKSGSLLVAIWFHAFFNAFSLSMLFITSLSGSIPSP